MKQLFLIALTVVTLSACNTVEGIGHDISGGARRVGTLF